MAGRQTYLAELIRQWRDDYDWRIVEARVRELPWEIAGAPDAPVRLVHQRAADPDAVAVLSAGDIADAVAEAMRDLGYDRYVVSGGDVGTDVAEWLAAEHPDRVSGLHLTDLSHRYARADPPADPSEEERAYIAAIERWHAEEGGYNHQQSTRPNTLAVGLGDSPAGLGAWIVEKLYAWTDCDGDLDSVFSRQEVLEWVSVYWVTGSIATSFAPYAHRVVPGRRMQPACAPRSRCEWAPDRAHPDLSDTSHEMP